MTRLVVPPTDSLAGRGAAALVRARRPLILALALALASLPLLLAHARELWSKEHYQFFPLLPIGAGFLAWRDLHGLGPLRPGPRTGTYALLGAAWATLALGILLPSPWLGMVATLVLLLAVALAVGGRDLVRRVLPAWFLLGLAVPLPNELDSRLVTALQQATASGVSAALDALGTLHDLDGNVFEIAGRRVEVEEACSGVRSLFAVLACTIFWAAWNRLRPWQAAVLTALAPAWVLVGNAARVLVIAEFDGTWGLDFTKGVPHEVLGLCLFAAMLGLVWSTHHLLLFFSGPGPRPWRRRRGMPGAWGPPPPSPAAAPGPEPPTPEALPTPPAFSATALAPWPVAAAFGLLVVAQAALWGAEAWFGGDDWSQDPVASAEATGEASLPEQLASWRRAGFEVKRRDRGHLLGANSRIWRFRGGGVDATVSADYPFPGWHTLTRCYAIQGWTVEEAHVERGEGDPGNMGRFVVAELRKAADYQYGYLVYQHRDRAGRPVEPTILSPWNRLRKRLDSFLSLESLMRGTPFVEATKPPTVQVQLLIVAHRPLTEAERREARGAFRQVVQALRRPRSQESSS